MRNDSYDYRAMTARAILIALLPQKPSAFDRDLAFRAVRLTDMLIDELTWQKERLEKAVRDARENDNPDEVDEKHPVVNGLLRVTRYDGKGQRIKVGNIYPCKFECRTAPNGNRYDICEKVTIIGLKQKTVITLKPGYCDWEEYKETTLWTQSK